MYTLRVPGKEVDKPFENNNLLLFLPKLCEFTKKKKKTKFTDCSVQTKNAITWATSHWVLTRYALTSETSPSRFCFIAFRDGIFLIQHLT